MFTDIEGYTAMMQKDEVQAIDIRNRHREIFDSLTEKYHGQTIQYYGDGILSIFNNSIINDMFAEESRYKALAEQMGLPI
jgi:class 3 adenylate cyclase